MLAPRRASRVNRKGDDPTLIPPGYVGVVTNKASDPVTGLDRGIQEQILQPGIYFLNPEEKRIDIVSIGYSETSLTVEAETRGGSKPTSAAAKAADSASAIEHRPARALVGRRSEICRWQGNRVPFE